MNVWNTVKTSPVMFSVISTPQEKNLNQICCSTLLNFSVFFKYSNYSKLYGYTLMYKRHVEKDQSYLYLKHAYCVKSSHFCLRVVIETETAVGWATEEEHTSVLQSPELDHNLNVNINITWKGNADKKTCSRVTAYCAHLSH